MRLTRVRAVLYEKGDANWISNMSNESLRVYPGVSSIWKGDGVARVRVRDEVVDERCLLIEQQRFEKEDVSKGLGHAGDEGGRGEDGFAGVYSTVGKVALSSRIKLDQRLI
jgi:hypothetical protein